MNREKIVEQYSDNFLSKIETLNLTKIEKERIVLFILQLSVYIKDYVTKYPLKNSTLKIIINLLNEYTQLLVELYK